METIANTQQNCTNFPHSRALDADQAKPRESAEFWRALQSPKGISRVCGYLNAAMTAVDCPTDRRSLLQALIELSDGQETFQATTRQIAERLYRVDPHLTGEERERRLRNIDEQAKQEIGRLMKWQTTRGVTLAQRKSGRQSADGYNIPSTWTLPINPIIEDIARQSGDLLRRREKDALRTAAETVIRERGASLSIPARRGRLPEIDPVKQSLRSCLGMGRKYAEAFGDPRTAYETLAREFQKLAEKNTPENKELTDNQGVVTTTPSLAQESDDLPPSTESQGGGIAGEADSLSAACDSLDCVEGGITEAEQLDELDGDAMTLLQAVLSVGGKVDQAFFKNDKEARGAGKGIDDEAKEPTTKITTERFSELLAGAIAKAGLMIRSFIARIRGPLLQIDDCDEHTVLRFELFALFVAETSPQNFQVWLAFKDEEDKEAAAKRLFTGKNGALAGGLKGNRGSSGAIRWAGSRNFKRDGAPLVRLDSVQMGRITTPAELDDAGLLDAPVAPVAVVALDAEPVRVSSSSWPDYNVALVKAERKPDSVEPDESNADSKWVTSCLTQYRKRRADVIAMLRQVSPHAREQEPESYAALTVDKVANYLQQKNGRVYA